MMVRPHLIVLPARRAIRSIHNRSPQRARYETGKSQWDQAFHRIDLFPPELTSDSLRRADVVHVLHPSGAWPAILAKHRWGIPYVVSIGYRPDRLCELRGRPGRVLAWRIWLKLLALNASGLMVSACPERWKGARGRVLLSPNGADLGVFRPGDDARNGIGDLR